MARRFFVIGLVSMLLFAAGHFAGFLQARHDARTNPAMAELTRAMRAHRAELMGFRPSILDFREYFSLNFSILLVLSAGLGFAALSLAGSETDAIRALSTWYAGAMIVLVGASYVYSVPQGIISCAFIAVVFGFARFLSG